MKTYYFARNGDYEACEISEADSQLIIRFRNRTYQVDLRQLNETQFHAIVNSRSVVFEAQSQPPRIDLTIEQRPYKFALLSHREKIQRELINQSAHVAHEVDIRAPMPGMVIKIEVKEGQEVKVGQPLLIMEAMKMENEIRAQAEGMVKKILVKAHQPVEKDEVLIKID